MPKNICVIGAGLAGGIIAHRLSSQNHNVTLVDMGDAPNYIEPDDETWRFDKPKAVFTRGQGFGGTSNFWHGGLTYLDESDISGNSSLFEEPKFPIAWDELRQYYRQATRILRGDCEFDFEQILEPPEIAGDGFEVDSELFKYKGLVYPKNAYSSCQAINEAVSNHGLKLLRNFKVDHIKFDASGLARSIEGHQISEGSKTSRSIEADLFILAAGGMGSPKILLNSIHHYSKLSHLPVGRFITDHPSGFVFKAKLNKRYSLRNLFAQPGEGFRTQFGFTLQPGRLNHANDQNHILYLRPAVTMKDPLLYDQLKRRLVGYKGKKINVSDIFHLFRHVDLLYDAINFKYGLFNSTRYVSGLTFLEQMPNQDDKISLAPDGGFSVDWRISQTDELSANKFLETFLRAHSNMFDKVEIFPNIAQRLDTSGHHSGGCRMSSNSASGVVDSSLKVFDTENLFVADGSVLPYTGHANTGLSIAAISLKCCDAVNNA